MNIGSAVLAFFVVVGPLILIHEIGHFVAARKFNIKVDEFGLGFPPRLWTVFEHNGTKYSINAIPIGGFVRPAGEDDPNVEGGLASASKTARFVVLAAGAGMNMVAAYLILVVAFMSGWREMLPGATILEVQPDSPAAEAGLQVDDLVTAVDGEAIEYREILVTHIHDKLGEPVELDVERGGESLVLTVVPRATWPESQGPTGITVGSPYEFKQYTPGEAFIGAGEELIFNVRLFFEIPFIIIRDKLPAEMLRPVSVVGISQMGGQAIDESIDEGQLFPILRLTSFISLALAMTNLLPLPALDGGRILFVLIEAVRGRRVTPEIEGMVHFVGVALLLTLMLFTIALDIVNPVVGVQ